MSGVELKTMTTSNDPVRQDVLDYICAQLHKLSHGKVAVSEHTDITTDLKLDSLTVMDLVFSLEEKFDIAIPLHDLADIYKVSELTNLVCKLKNRK